MKRVTLELGGKSPAIVFDDADMEKALFWCTFGITGNSGQVCAATSRLFVQESIADAVIAALKERFDAIARGLGADPSDRTTQYGPLIDKPQYERVCSYITEAAKDSLPAVGGKEYTGSGYYVAPTIFLNPQPDSKLYREEIFGPVLCVNTFKTEEEVIRMANDTEYGLAGTTPGPWPSTGLIKIRRICIYTGPYSVASREQTNPCWNGFNQLCIDGWATGPHGRNQAERHGS